jgi:hypothetical protein
MQTRKPEEELFLCQKRDRPKEQRYRGAQHKARHNGKIELEVFALESDIPWKPPEAKGWNFPQSHHERTQHHKSHAADD